MPSDGTIGRSSRQARCVLRIECPTCGRQGRYHVARLLEDLGAGYRLTDWLSERTADCPQKNQASITHATAQQMMVRGLIERDQAATRYALTDQGRAVLGMLVATR